MPLVLRILLALVSLASLALGGQAGEPAPAPPAPVELPACATCAGAGSFEQTCERCDGAGTLACAGCTPVARRRALHTLRFDLMRQRAPRFVGDEEATRKIEEAVAELEKGMSGLQRAFAGEKTRAPGRARCAANCVDGKPMLGTGRSCKACGGRGSTECGWCTNPGRRTCSECEGRRTRVAPCPECAGAGRARDARTLQGADVARCTWCGGSEVRACVACDANGTRVRVCEVCAGAKKHPCRTCGGTRRARCAPCSATGELDSIFDDGKKPKACPHCKSRGTLACESCASGVVECATCAGAGRGALACGLCIEKASPCAGCWDGGTRSWVVASERLLAAGNAPLAVRFLEEALRRAESVAKRRVARAGDDAAARREVERALARDRTELGAKLEAAKKQP